jgi:hypothetical protein
MRIFYKTREYKEVMNKKRKRGQPKSTLFKRSLCLPSPRGIA